MYPEVDFENTDIEKIAALFAQNGCVLLRRFCSPDALETLRGRLDALHNIIHEVHLYPKDLEAHGIAQPQEYLFGAKHNALLGRIFQDVPYRDLRGNVTRRMLGGWQDPLAPHLDAFFHPIGFTVNCWVPLQACGVTCPSLGVVCAPYDDIIRFTGYQPVPFWEDKDARPSDSFVKFRPLMKQMYFGHDEAARAELDDYFGDRVWTPEYRFGDAMMLSNWTFHFTHARPEMNGARTNIEMRFYSEATPEQVVEKLRRSLAEPAL